MITLLACSCADDTSGEVSTPGIAIIPCKTLWFKYFILQKLAVASKGNKILDSKIPPAYPSSDRSCKTAFGNRPQEANRKNEHGHSFPGLRTHGFVFGTHQSTKPHSTDNDPRTKCWRATSAIAPKYP